MELVNGRDKMITDKEQILKEGGTEIQVVEISEWL